jgi:translation initiation factor 2 alpha subunit (eIF-2alpha)
MAEVQMDEIVNHLRSEMRRALEDAVREVAPNAQIDFHELYRSFRRAVRRKCNQWEQVPDDYVRS